MQRTVWDRQIAAAEKFYEPGRLGTFIALEGTSSNDQQQPSNRHRVVVFKDGGNEVGEVLPYPTFDSPDREGLWEHMAAYLANTGGGVTAIPHDGKLSNGLMFASERLDGHLLDRAYARARMRWEPLDEVTQIQGDGEAHRKLSPEDESAGYGTRDKGDIAGFEAKTGAMLPHEHACSALQLGLAQAQEIGVNPFTFGMIGSTDAHTGLASTREENHRGKCAGTEPAADRYRHYVMQALSGDDSFSTFAREEISSGLEPAPASPTSSGRGSGATQAMRSVEPCEPRHARCATFAMAARRRRAVLAPMVAPFDRRHIDVRGRGANSTAGARRLTMCRRSSRRPVTRPCHR